MTDAAMPPADRTAESRLASWSRAGASRAARSALGRITGRISKSAAVSAWVQAIGRFLRRQLWAWPVIAAVVLGVSGWAVHAAVERAMREQRSGELKTILEADVTALRVWMDDQARTADLVGEDDQLLAAARELLPLADGNPGSERALHDARAQATLRAGLGRRVRTLGYIGYFVVTKSCIVLASDQDVTVGKALGGYRREFFKGVLDGRPSVSRPYRSTLLLADAAGELRANLPTMLAAAPIRDESGRPIAAIGLRIPPDEAFTRILQVARSGKTGETYAVDRRGQFLSESRFDEELKQIGLLADLTDSRSTLTLEARDPGVDMTAGRRPSARRPQQALTRAAAEVSAGGSGIDPDGYRDYRGAQVVGAWAWLPEYDFGVITEIDTSEAFRPMVLLRRAFWSLMGLLALGSVVLFLAMLFIARQQRDLQRAALQAKQLGQYTLVEKIGTGGMGTVYRARHAMLRRPTAVKLLDLEHISDTAIARFEREVQLTAGLTHPNTVAIFDYGRTPEGIFYYAMEYLDGCNLDELVARAGPISPARALHLLRQVCGSLAEAHASGLVHRDIKPANVFLCCRGGLHDFVKVLDFGLVKAVDDPSERNVTSAGVVTGTPLYISPEGVNDPNGVGPRSDVYAIGAVAYFLLTGGPVFSGGSVVDILMKHVREAPEPPSSRAGRPIPPDLERLILRCLAKAPAERPADAAALLRDLASCEVRDRWTDEDAASWWSALPARADRPASPATHEALVTSAIAPSPAADATVAFECPPQAPLAPPDASGRAAN